MDARDGRAKSAEGVEGSHSDAESDVKSGGGRAQVSTLLGRGLSLSNRVSWQGNLSSRANRTMRQTAGKARAMDAESVDGRTDGRN